MDASGNLFPEDEQEHPSRHRQTPPHAAASPPEAHEVSQSYPRGTIDFSSGLPVDRYTRLEDTTSIASEMAPTQTPTPERHYVRLQQELSGPITSSGTSPGTRAFLGCSFGGPSTAPSPNDSMSSSGKRRRLRVPAFFQSLSASSPTVWRCGVSTTADDDDLDDNSSTEASLMSEHTLKTRYEAESPDELALVRAACSYGCRLVKRTPNRAHVWLLGEYYAYL